LVKELLQNSLDTGSSTIGFKIEHDGAEQSVRVVCDDIGEGVEDFDKMRWLYRSFTLKPQSSSRPDIDTASLPGWLDRGRP
jgi:DNA mismatch repair ATPase MutL